MTNLLDIQEYKDRPFKEFKQRVKEMNNAELDLFSNVMMNEMCRRNDVKFSELEALGIFAIDEIELIKQGIKDIEEFNLNEQLALLNIGRHMVNDTELSKAILKLIEEYQPQV